MAKRKGSFLTQEHFEQIAQQKREDNLALIVDSLLYVDDDAISRKIELINSNQNLQTSIEVARDDDLSKLTTKVCSKSGAPIAKISIEQVQQMLEINGRERVVYMLKRRAVSCVSDSWIFTDARALDKLSEIDPLGYFVYAASRVLRAFQPGFNRNENAFSKDDSEAHYNFIYAKHDLWCKISEIPMEKIVSGNELMRRYLTIINSSYAHNQIKFSETNLSKLDVQTFLNEVKQALKDVLFYEHKKGRIKPNPTYSDIVDLQLQYKGNSNFRLQRNIRSLSDTDLVMHQLRDFMDEIKFGEYDESKKPWELRELKERDKPTNIRVHTGGTLVIKKAASTNKPVKVSFATLLRASRQRQQDQES